jgi:hypothetical protein
MCKQHYPAPMLAEVQHTYFKYLLLNTLFIHKPKDCVSDLDESLRADLKAKYLYASATLLKVITPLSTLHIVIAL